MFYLDEFFNHPFLTGKNISYSCKYQLRIRTEFAYIGKHNCLSILSLLLFTFCVHFFVCKCNQTKEARTCSKSSNKEPRVGIYLFKVNSGNTREICRFCSKLTIKTPERSQASLWCLYC